MLTLVTGGAGSGKTEFVFSEIEKILNGADRRVVLLVPEQQTVVYETEIARRFPPEAALRFEAMSFTRLSNAVARKTGGLSGSAVSRGAKALITWRAVSSVWDSLAVVSTDARGARGQLVPRISAAREEMKINAVTGAAAEEALARAKEAGEENDPAFLKLRDLFLISAAYESIVREELGGEYRETVLSDTVRSGAEAGFFDNTAVFVDSFVSVTKEEFRVLCELIAVCDVTVTVPLTDARAPLPHERPAKNYYDLLASFGERFTEVGRISLGGCKRAKTAELFAVSKYLFDYEKKTDDPLRESGLPSVPDSVRVFSVGDRYEEAEAAASVVERIVRDGGRYSDVAVISGDLGALHGIVEKCFERHGIPSFRTEPTTLESSPLARHFLSLLRIPGGWRREDVVRLIKTGLTDLSDGEASAFEIYTEVWNIRGRRMFSTPWSMNPAGYTAEMGDGDRALLSDANSGREKLIPPVETFVSVFGGGEADVRDIAGALVRYSEESGLYSALKRRSELLRAAGDADGAVRELGTFRKMMKCLDDAVRYLPGVKCDAEGFSSILRFAMTDAGAGAIPTGVDEVALGSAATIRTGRVRHVILLGCVAGEFPGAADDSGFFSDAERETLAGAGIDLWSDGRERSAMELLRFHRSAALPSDSLTLFVPSSSFGSQTVISAGAERVLSVLGREEPVPFSSLPVEERLFSRAGIDNAILAARKKGDGKEEAALLRMRSRLEGDVRSEKRDPSSESVSGTTAAAIFGGDVVISETKMNKYVECPFSFYLDFVLKMGERKRAEFSGLNRGLFVHYVLEQFFARTKDGDYPLPREETEAICDEIIDGYVGELFGDEAGSERVKYVVIALRRTALLFVNSVMEEMAQSRFRIVSTETAFGKKGSPESPRIPLGDGTTLSFNGKIDRIDTYRKDGKTFVRIVDYKTGKQDFDLDKIKAGIDVQLLVYLFSVWRSNGVGIGKILGEGEIVPAGAEYLHIDFGRTNEKGPVTGEEAFRARLENPDRKGLFLCESDVLDAMDRGITGKYVPLGKNGSPSEFLVSLERFGELSDELEKTVASVAKSMKSGVGAARSASGFKSVDPCVYCDGKAVCRLFKKKANGGGSDE